MSGLERERIGEHEVTHTGIGENLRDVGTVRFEAEDGDFARGEHCLGVVRSVAHLVEQRGKRAVVAMRAAALMANEDAFSYRCVELSSHTLWSILGQPGCDLIDRQRLTEGGKHFLRNLNGGFPRQLQCSEIGAQMIAAVAKAHDLQTGSQAVPGVGHHTTGRRSAVTRIDEGVIVYPPRPRNRKAPASIGFQMLHGPQVHSTSHGFGIGMTLPPVMTLHRRCRGSFR